LRLEPVVRSEYQATLAARDAKAKETGKKPRGRLTQPPQEGPGPSDQINLTDEESRIMPVAGGGLYQCDNAQALGSAGDNKVTADTIGGQIASFAASAGDGSDEARRLRAIGTWSTMIGAMLLSRISEDPALSKEILDEPLAWITSGVRTAEARANGSLISVRRWPAQSDWVDGPPLAETRC
jgi:hypothetical protein